MLKKINLKKFKDLYRKHIVKDFPRAERTTLNKFKKRIIRGQEEVYIYKGDGKEKAYIIVAVLNNYIMVSFLAVFEKYRGEGIGTKLLKEIKEKFNNKKGILLEVENPQYSIDEADKITRQRRIKFYEKSNYIVIDGVELNLHSTMFNIMILTINDVEIEKKEIAKELNGFYTNIFRRYDKNLSFRIIEG